MRPFRPFALIQLFAVATAVATALFVPAPAEATARSKLAKPVRSLHVSAGKATRPVAIVAIRRHEALTGTAKRRVQARAARPGREPGRGREVVDAGGRQSFGQLFGLHAVQDPLDLKSSVALVVDQDSSEVLLAKNSNAVLPIASLTKLMTALVVVEAQQPLDEMLTITNDDIDFARGSHSRLFVGAQLSRGEMLQLALMSSENRAANALGRHFPGGLPAFVASMNRKARELGMRDTRYVEPTGLSSDNQSSAGDLAALVRHAYRHALIRELSTTAESEVMLGDRSVQFRNTNGLVRSPEWEIGLQKTGYITEAGRCLVMQARMAGRRLIMVFLDSAGKYSRLADAERVRRWLTGESVETRPTLVSSRAPY